MVLAEIGLFIAVVLVHIALFMLAFGDLYFCHQRSGITLSLGEVSKNETDGFVYQFPSKSPLLDIRL
ncbi:hypothetical protein VCHA53O466_50463 [Vibrio chagasii]|nr:hypothetical protein VCHA53O466_50463 [Vibrio chagasii]